MKVDMRIRRSMSDATPAVSPERSQVDAVGSDRVRWSRQARDAVTPNTPDVRERGIGAWALDVLARNSLLVVLVAVLGSTLLALAPELLVADSWMTLAAGREISDHGLPSHEVLTVIPFGRDWTDQQWLAQVVFYGASALGGLRLAVLLDVALVALTLALGVIAARRRGASARSTLFVATACVFVAPWSWQLRAQALSLPLFVLVLALASEDVRNPRNRTWLALPIVAVWANLHGSVLLGAGVVSLAGVVGLGRRLLGASPSPPVWRSVVVAVAPWACVVASPYGLDLLDYYRLMLFDSPVSKVIVEWQAPTFHGWYLIFFGVAAVTAVLAAWQWRRLGFFDLTVLAVTLAGSLRSGRGIVWFTLAVLVLLPVALDGVFRGKEVPFRRRISVILGVTAATVLTVAVVAVATRPDSWYENLWPERALRRVESATANAGRLAVFPSDKHADWLLWKLPDLRSRVAYDVRFELLTAAELRSIVRFKSLQPGWERAADGYRVVVLDPGDTPQHRRRLVRQGLRVVYADGSIVVLVRGA
jgi:hypothetical protein